MGDAINGITKRELIWGDNGIDLQWMYMFIFLRSSNSQFIALELIDDRFYQSGIPVLVYFNEETVK